MTKDSDKLLSYIDDFQGRDEKRLRNEVFNFTETRNLTNYIQRRFDEPLTKGDIICIAQVCVQKDYLKEVSMGGGFIFTESGLKRIGF